MTNAYDMSGTGGPKFALLLGDNNTTEPTLADNGQLGTNTSVATYWKNTKEMVHNGAASFSGNVAIGTTPHATFKLDVLSTATDWAARVKNYTTDGYGLAVDCSGGASSTTYALAVYDAAGGANFFVRNDGLASLGLTPYATAANARLQLPSHALSINCLLYTSDAADE